MKFREKIKPFLSNKCQIVLGLSGGPDSMVLFHLLRKVKISFRALYIDHGWRNKSKEEAEQLADLCEKLEVPFSVREVKGFDFAKGNIEDRLRNERWKFFKESEADILILGHHLDDHIETVIKRLFEGAKLTKLGGIALESEVGTMRVVRPLLECHKSEIINWANSNQVHYFIDETNEDQHFLRARMRKRLIPQLEDSFGKGIGQNLNELSQVSSKLKLYLDRKTDPYLAQFESKRVIPNLEEEIEMRHLFDRVANKLSITFSREQVATLVTLGQKGESGKFVESKSFKCLYRAGSFRIEKKELSKNVPLC
ncbi:MAG: tRNA lysidine(34) synthetase TilS [Rhabdochlamydiaceae bacterium]|nr:tRNA lysidine(34) synthetase TilS [Candidatus Amphrikana amoebophyrae]